MLKGAPKWQIDTVLRRLVVDNPSHEFDMDYHICSDVGLRVSEMLTELSVTGKETVKHLEYMASEEWIGQIVRRQRLPFFQYFQYTPVALESDEIADMSERDHDGRKETAEADERAEAS